MGWSDINLRVCGVNKGRVYTFIQFPSKINDHHSELVNIFYIPLVLELRIILDLFYRFLNFGLVAILKLVFGFIYPIVELF